MKRSIKIASYILLCDFQFLLLLFSAYLFLATADILPWLLPSDLFSTVFFVMMAVQLAAAGVFLVLCLGLSSPKSYAVLSSVNAGSFVLFFLLTVYTSSSSLLPLRILSFFGIGLEIGLIVLFLLTSLKRLQSSDLVDEG